MTSLATSNGGEMLSPEACQSSQNVMRHRKTIGTQRAFYRVHLWTGAAFSWLLFAVCLTGTLVVYKFPLKALSNPSMIAGVRSDLLGPDGALAAVRERYPEATPRVVAFPSDIYSVHLYSVVMEKPDGTRNRVWVNPESGNVTGELDSEFADFILRLHANLFLGKPGRWLVGFLGLAMLTSLISGLFFHWRRVRRDALHLRLFSRPRTVFGDLHKAAGVWWLPFHFIIAVTGAWLGLESLIDMPASASAPLERSGNGAGNPKPIAEIVANAQSMLPEFTATHVNMTDAGARGATIRVQGDLPGHQLVQRGQTMLVFDADSGSHLQTVDRRSESITRRILAMVRPLHYGYFWPFWGELIYFVGGLAATVLALTGPLIWSARQRQRLSPHRLTTEALDRINVGVMGGLLLALSGLAFAHDVARLFDADLLGFHGSHSLFTATLGTDELKLFLLLWILSGTGAAYLKPRKAWKAIAIALAALLLSLPLLGLMRPEGMMNWRTGAHGALGYSCACFLLAVSAAVSSYLLAKHEKYTETTP